MAKIVSIGNRAKIAFWAAVARELAERRGRIGWIVQNQVFAPDTVGEVVVMPFPPRDGTPGEPDPDEALTTDRGTAFFKSGTQNYRHYAAALGAAMDRVPSESVIGERTLFQELIAIVDFRALDRTCRSAEIAARVAEAIERAVATAGPRETVSA